MKSAVKIMLLYFFITSFANAEIYKCPNLNGKIIYQQVPCKKGLQKQNGEWKSVEGIQKQKKEKQLKEKRRKETELNRQRVKTKKKNDLENLKFKKEIAKNREIIRNEKKRVSRFIKELVKVSPALSIAIAGSDDLSHYQYEFMLASNTLVKKKICKINELKEIGGWVKSTNFKNEPMYFTYCGHGKRSITKKENKIYLNAKKGIIFRQKAGGLEAIIVLDEIKKHSKKIATILKNILENHEYQYDSEKESAMNKFSYNLLTLRMEILNENRKNKTDELNNFIRKATKKFGYGCDYTMYFKYNVECKNLPISIFTKISKRYEKRLEEFKLLSSEAYDN